MLRYLRAKVHFAISAQVIFAGSAMAIECQCPQNQPSLKDSYTQAGAVFVGTVDKYGASALRPGMNEAQVRLMSRLKGLEETKGSSIYIYTPDGPEKCGMKLLVSQDYLFFAEGNLARLVVNACSRTEILDNALDQMEELQRISKKQ